MIWRICAGPDTQLLKSAGVHQCRLEREPVLPDGSSNLPKWCLHAGCSVCTTVLAAQGVSVIATASGSQRHRDPAPVPWPWVTLLWHWNASWQGRGQTWGPPQTGVWGIPPRCVPLRALASLHIPVSRREPDGPDIRLWWVPVQHVTCVLWFLSLYPFEMLKHQPRTLTNSTWTFSSCFFLKQSKNTLV